MPRRIRQKQFLECLEEAFYAEPAGDGDDGFALSFEFASLKLADIIRPFLGQTIPRRDNLTIEVPHDLSWVEPDGSYPLHFQFNKPIVIQWTGVRLFGMRIIGATFYIRGITEETKRYVPAIDWGNMVPVPLYSERDHSPP